MGYSLQQVSEVGYPTVGVRSGILSIADVRSVDTLYSWCQKWVLSTAGVKVGYTTSGVRNRYFLPLVSEVGYFLQLVSEVGYSTAGVRNGILSTAGVRSGILSTAGVRSGILSTAGVRSGILSTARVSNGILSIAGVTSGIVSTARVCSGYYLQLMKLHWCQKWDTTGKWNSVVK